MGFPIIGNKMQLDKDLLLSLFEEQVFELEFSNYRELHHR